MSKEINSCIVIPDIKNVHKKFSLFMISSSCTPVAAPLYSRTSGREIEK